MKQKKIKSMNLCFNNIHREVKFYILNTRDPSTKVFIKTSLNIYKILLYTAVQCNLYNRYC